MHKLDDQRAVITEVDGRNRKVFRQAPARLVRPGADADLRYARLSVGGRRRIYRRLGARRRTGDTQNDAQASGGAALQFRNPRHRNDGFAASSVRPMAQSRASTTSDVFTRSRPSGQKSWRSPATPISRACRTVSATSSGPSPSCLAHDGVVAWDGAKILDWYLAARK